MTRMRAALFDAYGPPEVLYEGTLPIPTIGPRDVLVRNRACTVNGGELFLRAGRLQPLSGRRFPFPLGVDFVGEVAAVGSAVTTTRVGERVWGVVEERRRLGAAAEYAVATDDLLAPAPANLTDLEAAALIVAGTTALTGLRDKARLRPGERLLVRGGTGGVGSLAVQVGRLFGAHVTALAHPAHTSTLHELGADEVIDYHTPPSRLGRYDVILDSRCTDLPAYRRRLAPGGRMVALAFDLDHVVRSLGYLAASTVHGRSRVRFFRGRPAGDLLIQLTRYAEAGQLRPVVHEVYPLHEMAAAHAALQAGGVVGKLVIDVSPAR